MNSEDERDNLLDKARKEADKINRLAEDRFAADESAFGVDEESFVSGANWAFDRSQRTVIRITPEAVQREYDLRNGAAPTDDEREDITDEALWDFAGDLLDSWNIEDQNPPSLTEDFRDRFVARFRRFEVSEPSAYVSGVRHAATVLAEKKGWTPQEAMNYLGFGDAPEPQGEPTDAQVKAALDEYLRAETGGKVRAMRSALRAAKEAKS